MGMLLEELYDSSLPMCFPLAHTPFIAVYFLYTLLSKTLQCCSILNYICMMLTMNFPSQGAFLQGYCP